MSWKEILEKRMKARRQILFSKDDDVIMSLNLLIDDMPRRAVILWALELAEETVMLLETKYPFEKRPRTALTMTRMWASGEVKMPVAKHAILDCHAVAKEISSTADIARCHAIGQACGTVHANGHAIGFPIYDLTALIRENGLENCDEIICNRMNDYLGKLFYWRENYRSCSNQWASFLTDENSKSKHGKHQKDSSFKATFTHLEKTGGTMPCGFGGLCLYVICYILLQ